MKTDNDHLPPKLWLYSQLVNLEIDIENTNAEKLMMIYLIFIKKYYHIDSYSLGESNFHEIIKTHENNEEYASFYTEMYDNIQKLRNEEVSTVIDYIKKIKLLFNKDEVLLWLNDNIKNCNNC